MWAHAIVLATCVAALWLPFGGLPLPALGEPQGATQFLNGLWQVTATLIGFSLVVLVLVVDLTHEDSLASHSALAQSGVPLVFVLGLSLIATAGLASAGLGHGGPTGWAGSLPLVLTGVVLVGLLFTGGRALRLVSAGTRQSLRASALRTTLRSSIDRTALTRIAKTSLEETRARWMPIVLWKDTEMTIIRADRSGAVRDVNLRRLRRLSRMVSTPVEVCVLPGTSVTPSSPLMVLPLDAPPEAETYARRIVSVEARSSPPDDWNEALSRLLDEGFESLRASRLALYTSAGDRLIEALCALGPEWRAYGVSFERHHAEDSESPLGRSWLDLLERELHRHLRESLGDDDRTQVVLRLPSALAFRAHEEDIIGLTETALSIIGRAPFPCDGGAPLEHACFSHLHLFLRYSLLTVRQRERMIPDPRSESDQKLARQTTSLCTEIERAQIDRDDWSGLGRAWEEWQQTADQASRQLEDGGRAAHMGSTVLIEHLANRMLLVAWMLRGTEPSHDLPLSHLPTGGRSVLSRAIARGLELGPSKWIPWTQETHGTYVGPTTDTNIRQAAALLLASGQPEHDESLDSLLQNHRDAIATGFSELAARARDSPACAVAMIPLEDIERTARDFARRELH